MASICALVQSGVLPAERSSAQTDATSWVLGTENFSTALVFSGSTWIPAADTMCPRNLRDVERNCMSGHRSVLSKMKSRQWCHPSKQNRCSLSALPRSFSLAFGMLWVHFWDQGAWPWTQKVQKGKWRLYISVVLIHQALPVTTFEVDGRKSKKPASESRISCI